MRKVVFVLCISCFAGCASIKQAFNQSSTSDDENRAVFGDLVVVVQNDYAVPADVYINAALHSSGLHSKQRVRYEQNWTNTNDVRGRVVPIDTTLPAVSFVIKGNNRHPTDPSSTSYIFLASTNPVLRKL